MNCTRKGLGNLGVAELFVQKDSNREIVMGFKIDLFIASLFCFLFHQLPLKLHLLDSPIQNIFVGGGLNKICSLP